MARGVANVARHSLDVAITYLEGLKQLYGAGVNALNALARFSLTQIIYIQEIYFNVGLDVANEGSFMCQVKGTAMGQKFTRKLEIDVNKLCPFAMSLANLAVPGLSNNIC